MDNASPVYHVTDHAGQLSSFNNTDHDSHSESDDAMFSEASSDRTMSTLQSSHVAGSSCSRTCHCFANSGICIYTEYFRSIHGFTYLNDEDFPTVWPTDNIAERLDIVHHTIVRLAHDGTNVSAEIDEMLRSGGVEGGAGGAAVLDIATNSGTW